MEYAYPQFLNYTWVLAIYAAAALALLWRQWRAHRSALEAPLARRFGPSFSALRSLVKLALVLAAAWLMLQALACRLGTPQKVEADTQGADLLVAVDVSSSMHAADFKPDRLAAVKQVLAAFFNTLEGDRVGLVAFAGKAVIACPLTTDYETLGLFLDKLDTDSVPEDGTGLAPALQLCLDKFSPDPKRGRMILLVTDGEDNQESDSLAEARRAAAAGVPIYTLGIGTPGGATIPEGVDFFGRVHVKTFQGQAVVTRLDDKVLRRISEITGGVYAYGSSLATLEGALERLRQLKQGTAKGQARFTRELLFQEPLLWCLLLLLAEGLLSTRYGGTLRTLNMAFSKARQLFDLALRRRGWKAACLWLALGLCLSGFSLDPGRAEYDQGNALYKSQKYQEAGAAYQASLGQDPGRAAAHYNLGNSFFQQGDYASAVGEYENTLKLDPRDQDAAFNLELAKRRMQGESKDQKGRSKDEKKEGEKKQQGQQQQQGGGQQKGAKQGQGKGAKAEAKQAKLNQEEAQALMNMLKSDQQRYKEGFNPLKKFNKKPPKDAMDQMFEQMTGRKIPGNEGGDSGNKKNW